MLPQQYCLRWKYHHSNLQTMFSQLLDRGCFCDVTIACDGQLVRAHRVVLCACSTFFDALLTNYASDKDPIIIMKDAKYGDIKYLIEFMYKGEINVEHEHLASLLKTAEELKIKGLAEVSWREDDDDSGNHLDSNPKSIENPPPPPRTDDQRIPRMPLLTPISSPNHQELPHPGPKRKRGRPPLDDSYDVFSTPKIAFVEGAATHFNESPVIVDPPNVEDVTMINDHNHVEPVESSNRINNNDRVDTINHGDRVEHIHHNNEPTQSDEWANSGGDSNVDSECEKDEKPNPQQLVKNDIANDYYEPPECISEDLDGVDGEGNGANDGLTKQEMEEWKDVIKMDDYLANGRRPHFWEEPFTKRVMEAIKTKKLEMKKASQILGVSYGTLYGRYRETHGCLKHPYRGASIMLRYHDFWPEKRSNSVESKRTEYDIGDLWLK